MLEVKNLSKNFGGVKALDGCTLKVDKSKIIAVIGPNGSGKSTLFHVISGLYNGEEGEVEFDGKNLNGMDDHERARLGIARTFQEVRLFKNLTIKDHIEIALSEQDEKLFGSMFGKKEDFEGRVGEALRLVGLDKDIFTFGSDLSYGQQKLLDLAVAIAKPHKLIMLDEPVAGVNPKLREKIKDVLKKLRDDGETVLLIEHDMNFVMGIADYVFVLDHGQVISHGTPAKIQKDKKVLEAYLGE